MDFCQNTCFKAHSNMVVAQNLWVKINLYKELGLPVITWNIKHWSKQVVSMIYTLGKEFLAAVTFKALWDISFQTE